MGRADYTPHYGAESDTVDATLPKRSVDPRCVPKPFNRLTEQEQARPELVTAATHDAIGSRARGLMPCL